eukprot:6604892-Pyramimonas_sp.AAC.1
MFTFRRSTCPEVPAGASHSLWNSKNAWIIAWASAKLDSPGGIMSKNLQTKRLKQGLKAPQEKFTGHQ